MNQNIVVVGIGQLGGIFSKGILACGYPVYPITRNMSMENEANVIYDPKTVLVSVAEGDLNQTLGNIPVNWRNRLTLLQNELLPRDWQAFEIADPTIISVWFEKKKGMDSKVLLPSPVYGPNAQLIGEALEAIDIPVQLLNNEVELEYELVRKNVYIISINVAGLIVGGTVGELWQNHEDFARKVVNDVLDVQSWLVGHELDRDRLLTGMLEAFDADLDHKCMGRTAPDRLRRALGFAEQAGLEVPTLKDIAAEKLYRQKNPKRQKPNNK